MRKLILAIMQSRPYKWFLKDALPFIRFSTQLNKIRGATYHDGYSRLRAGHIIVCVDKHKATSLLIPGLTSHAAICIGKRPGGFEIAEMTHTDFTYSDFFDICKESSRVFILSCPDWDKPTLHGEDYLVEVIAAVHSLKKAKYDTEFLLGVEALYCSELVYMADQIAAHKLEHLPRLKVDLTDLAGLGRPYLSPDGLLFGDNLICLWDSDYEVAGRWGPQIEYVLRGSYT